MTDAPIETLALLLSEKMAAERYSDRVLAVHLGLDKSAICRARQGKPVKVETFLALCGWLGFKLSQSVSPTTP